MTAHSSNCGANPDAVSPVCPFCAMVQNKQVDLSPIPPRNPIVYASVVGFMVGIVRASQLKTAKSGAPIIPDGTCDECKATMRKLVPSAELV